jgi:hypothetical protein
MAFKEGMGAIAQVLKVLAIASGALCLAGALWNVIPNSGSLSNAGMLLFCGFFFFLLFWTPAWVIRKFIQ